MSRRSSDRAHNNERDRSNDKARGRSNDHDNDIDDSHINSRTSNSVSKKKFKFSQPPIIIGDYALELHKIATDAAEETLFLLVSVADFDILRTVHTDQIQLPYGECVVDEKGIHYFKNWYAMTYDSVIKTAVKIRSKLVPSKDVLLLMSVYPAFDKKNKVSRAAAKKFQNDVAALVNQLI